MKKRLLDLIEKQIEIIRGMQKLESRAADVLGIATKLCDELETSEIDKSNEKRDKK